MAFQCECTKANCRCSGHPGEGERCRNLHGQQNLFSNAVIILRTVNGVLLCDDCMPRPVATPSNLSRQAWNNDKKRLAAQETLFDFR